MSEKLPNVHPGEVLLEEFIKPLGITTYKLAKAMAVSPSRVAAIIKGERSVSVNTAIRLSRVFKTTPDFWVTLQRDFDIEEEMSSGGIEFDKLESLVP